MSRPELRSIAYPGRIIQSGERDKTIVRTLQQRLNARGCGPIDEDGRFDDDSITAVKLFQSRFTDADGLPLKIDGKVGALSWGALFGRPAVPPVSTAESPLLTETLRIAAGEIGVMENPPGSNRGPKVDEYLQTTGLDPTKGSFAWCAAFVYWSFNQASTNLGTANPVAKTAGVLDHWSKAARNGGRRILLADALNDPALVQPGHIFILSVGRGAGHTGLVESVADGKLITIEGNTNDGGSREGIGVFRRDRRKIADINRGFIDYSG
jgi:hypothetical protein